MGTWGSGEQRLGGGGEGDFVVHRNLHVGGSLLGERLRKLGEKVLAEDAGNFFSEREFDIRVGGAFDGGGVGVGVVGMDDESAAGLGLDVEIELCGLTFGKLQAGELLGNCGGDGGLNLLLQFHAGGGFERGRVGIARTGDETAFGLGLDAVGEGADDAFKVHGMVEL